MKETTIKLGWVTFDMICIGLGLCLTYVAFESFKEDFNIK